MPSGDSPIFSQGLTKRFGSLTAVDQLSFSVDPGEIFGLVGPDGAGKSTTLRLLSSILDPTEGQASIAGYDVCRDPEAVKDHLAYMSQRFALYSDLTVKENINFYADLYGVPKRGREARIDELLAFSYMGPFKKRLAGNLSGGMKQKLQLVCALVHTPKVLLLDEPTSGVDPLSRRDFWRILYQLLQQGVSILVTTAYLDEAERCHRVGLLHRGSLLAVGTPEAVKGLMQGRILTIQSHQARKISRLLRRRWNQSKVNVFGNHVHVVCADPYTVREEVGSLLSEAGLEWEDMREQQATLEDVFVSALDQWGARPPGGEIKVAGESLGPSLDAHMHEKAVEVHDLTRRFGAFTAVDGLTFEVPQGEIFGFLGPNGAGKSTTIRMLCGLLGPTTGEGRVAGFEISTQAERIKQHIGYMSQKFSLYEDLTVEENIEFYGGIYGLHGPRMVERKAWAVDMAGLEDQKQSLTATLSGGWKQRLAMACAVLHSPPIVFLDEPTSGVDPVSRRRFWDLIYEMADQGVTVFVTTHYMEEAEYCDRLALIYRGKTIALGTPLELKTRVMGDQILNIGCPRPQEVMDLIGALPEVRDVGLFGSGLHAAVRDAAEAERAVRRVLDDRGRERAEIEKITPSMEDVFVSLIEEVDRDGRGTGSGAQHA